MGFSVIVEVSTESAAMDWTRGSKSEGEWFYLILATGGFGVGVVSALRSPMANWIPASICFNKAGFQKTCALCPNPL